jgi:hypothetical protein
MRPTEPTQPLDKNIERNTKLLGSFRPHKKARQLVPVSKVILATTIICWAPMSARACKNCDRLSDWALWAQQPKCGSAGYRSLCLMDANHALYHLSYKPASMATLVSQVFIFPPTDKVNRLV